MCAFPPYRFWLKPLLPIVVLTTIEALEATLPHSALERAKRAFVKVLVSAALGNPEPKHTKRAFVKENQEA